MTDGKLIISVLLLLAPVAHAADSRAARAILSQHCFKCHGPDEQKSGLRLDKPDADNTVAIAAGKPDESEVLRRIRTHDPDDAMPPAGEKRLTAKEIAVLESWVAAGARFETHWAYVKPVRPVVPDGQNAIDFLIRTRLQAHGLTPSAPASATTLCRRLYLDLIGLPPTPAEVEAFVAADKLDRRKAVEATVDKLLSSPRFGEKWARHWLDLARYGDSAGYQHDDDMPLWLYRDWVINAFNTDMPFDQFTIEQLAGDLLPNATLSQRIATGFHRGATVTLGADQNVDELRAQIVTDRVNTVGTTWLATSLECAQCHTHKFDPIPQVDHYKMYAYFNRTVPELSKPEGSHYFITGGILEMPIDDARRARVEQIEQEMRVEIAKMTATKVDLSAAPLRRIFTGPDDSRRPERVYYYLTDELRGNGPPAIAANIRKLRELGRQLLAERPPRALVLQEDPNPPDTHVLQRGSVHTPGDKVSPGVLSALNPLPADAPGNRLGLARWLVSRDNPLTARVAVNRLWAELFGTGIVATPEEFGAQGELPANPELLDWLAVEFMDRGWKVKDFIRMVVTSDTYQQSSVVTERLAAEDPRNQLLARGPRFRLEAELLRDNALTIAGLLEHRLGGEPAPATRFADGIPRDGFEYRRGIYLRQQRGTPYTTFISLDAPERFTCTARRPRTNTPLQALALMNEPVFAEAASALAARDAGIASAGTFDGRADLMFQRCTGRLPSADERAVLRGLYDKTIRDGADERAAWRIVANVLLNLDETLTKE